MVNTVTKAIWRTAAVRAAQLSDSRLTLQFVAEPTRIGAAYFSSG
jgi:hypothetical protein